VRPRRLGAWSCGPSTSPLEVVEQPRRKLWLPVLVTYVVTAGALLYLGFHRPLEYALVPLVILTGWAFLGHIITLDDDWPGRWSNPERSSAVWKNSLLHLLAKGIVFGVVTMLVVVLLR